MFDEERALDAAMRTFWANGYEATSTKDLCDATGLGRSSIYNTFTSKHELFQRALTRYMDGMTSAQTAVLDDAEQPPTERIRTLFAQIIEGEFSNRREGRSLGCLTVNTTVELAGHDAETAQLLDRDRELRLSSLRDVLALGQRTGEFGTRQDPETLAHFVTSMISGMRVAAQGGADRATLESIAATAIEALAP
ncbi:TetR family transcriptional regulator [Murinocardiopsis flavida]|uniref:TetR family transcriptional regulator n=2 Tax=Murinocardiopsis flavida TaxID=645275 RepID=A0A2P8CT05_9ACTN|nr:TetR family transcriptional regulator [Murinocardiopsis flavida]